jgi:hypothetical protein
MVSMEISVGFAELSNTCEMTFLRPTTRNWSATAASGNGELWPFSIRLQTIHLLFAYAQIQLKQQKSQKLLPQTAFKGILR